jgi:CRP/FNR family cyclic AMP-dependent transcriptional regulator
MDDSDGQSNAIGNHDMATTAALTKGDFTTIASIQPETPGHSVSSSRAFGSLKQREIEDLLAVGWTCRIPRGQVVYCAGDVLQHLYLVESGSVKLIRSSEEGKELIVGLVGPGECFGSMVHSRPTGNLSQALEDSRIFLVPHQSVRRIAAANPSFALDLLKMNEQQLVDAQAMAARLAFDTVPHRLARLLLAISDPRYGTFRYAVNQTEIANLIGSSRETVCSILNRLRRDGMLSIVKGRIRVLERDTLATVR